MGKLATVVTLEEQLPLSCSHSNEAVVLDHIGSLGTTRKTAVSGTD